MNKIRKIVNEIDDAEKGYSVRVDGINKDISASIQAMSEMDNSLDFLDDNKDVVDAKRNELTHYKLHLKEYPSDADKFRYKMVITIFFYLIKKIEQTVLLLKADNI